MTSSMQSPPVPPQGEAAGRAANLLLLCMQAVAVSVEVFVRREIGSRYLDRQAALALLLIPGFGLLWPEEDLEPLVWFLGAYVCACGCVRLAALGRRFRGQEEHSRYNGWPRILRLPLLRRVSEARAKSLVEPVLVFGVGGLVTNASLPLGTYLMVASFALIANDGLLRAFEAQRILDLKDQLADQRRIAERIRDGRW